MASTYSDLKFELIGTGEQSGTWGTTTNTNLGTAIQEAITGSADVTFASAQVTLTLTDTNASQTARNLRLNLTGTSGGAQNLIVPAIEKLYLVNNGCADAITVKNSTGTGIAVPAGKAMLVFNDGTNVVDATTHLSSLTLATDLAVADGGTGASDATTAQQNLGVEVGVDVQAYDAGLADIAGLAVTDGNIIVGDGANWVAESGATARTSLGLGSIATQNSNSVTITGGSVTGITDLTVADGGTGASSITANSVILGNGTSALSGNLVAPGTSGNILTSNGTTWTSTAPAASGGFDAGTKMVFQQTAAPTGWTKDTTAALNDSLMRIVTGTASSGGSTGFSTYNAATTTGATTLSTSQIPSHTHVMYGGNEATNYNGFLWSNVNTAQSPTTQATGGNGSHTHSMTKNIKYYDFIIATKD